MTPQQADQYINLPWQAGAKGPDAYDCWGLLQEVRNRYFGVSVPDVRFGDAARDLYEQKLRNGDWEIVPIPAHGDGVLLRDGNHPHVGVYLDIDGGGILHALEGVGVTFTRLSQLRMMGFSNPKFYRIHG